MKSAPASIEFDPIGENRWIVADQRIAGWVADRILHVSASFGPCVALGVWDGRAILAGVVFHDYNPSYRNVQISMAADTARWATRTTIARLMAYPFRQLGVDRVTTLIPAKNSRALRFNEGLGFKREGLCRLGFGDDDCVVMGLLKREAPDWMLQDTSI